MIVVFIGREGVDSRIMLLQVGLRHMKSGCLEDPRSNTEALLRYNE